MSKTRIEIIKELRPHIPTINGEKKSLEVELFQNEVLRPILKFQHEILIIYFNLHHKSGKKIEQSFPEDYEQIVKDELHKNSILWNNVLGFILGLMSSAELQYHSQRHKELNKRIKNMPAQRIASTMDLSIAAILSARASASALSLSEAALSLVLIS